MDNIINDLYEIILDRKNNGAEGSYTNYLFTKGLDKILKKVGEECTEVIIASKNGSKEDQINEICDLTYHLLVLMAKQEISLGEVNNELIKRREKIGNLKAERKEVKVL